MNILAEVAVAAARHARNQTRQPEQRLGTVTAVTEAPSGSNHGTAVVQIAGYATPITVANVADAVVADKVIVSFPSVGVAYLSAWL